MTKQVRPPQMPLAASSELGWGDAGDGGLLPLLTRGHCGARGLEEWHVVVLLLLDKDITHPSLPPLAEGRIHSAEP